MIDNGVPVGIFARSSIMRSKGDDSSTTVAAGVSTPGTPPVATTSFHEAETAGAGLDPFPLVMFEAVSFKSSSNLTDDIDDAISAASSCHVYTYNVETQSHQTSGVVDVRDIHACPD